MITPIAIAVKQVSKTYMNRSGETLAVQNISFTVPEGSFVSLVGPSGCGKSTLLSLVAGLFRPSEGSITLWERPVDGPSPVIGYMLQQDYLLGWRTILENAVLGLEIRGERNEKTEAHVRFLLKEMGLEEVEHHYPHQLSGGMRQRVALVRTLATNPKVLLLDEPFSALDFQTKLKLEDLVISTLRKHQKTAILVTHDLSEAIAMSDQVILLDHHPGTIRAIWDIPEAIRQPLPFQAREVEGFQALFRKMWKELESDG